MLGLLSLAALSEQPLLQHDMLCYDQTVFATVWLGQQVRQASISPCTLHAPAVDFDLAGLHQLCPLLLAVKHLIHRLTLVGCLHCLGAPIRRGGFTKRGCPSMSAACRGGVTGGENMMTLASCWLAASS